MTNFQFSSTEVRTIKTLVISWNQLNIQSKFKSIVYVLNKNHMVLFILCHVILVAPQLWNQFEIQHSELNFNQSTNN